ncbi:MAG: hypothetical protein NVSMB39_7180 [Candidatus Saccharimonadales bacterium]
MNMKFDLYFKKLLPVLRKLQPYVFGLGLIMVFGYTAYAVNAALNVQPDTAAVAAPDPAAKIIFDKKTIDYVKSLPVVQGTVPIGDLGKADPFK